MVCAAWMKPRDRSVNFSMSMSLSLSQATERCPPRSQATRTLFPVAKWGMMHGDSRASGRGKSRMRIEHLYRYPVKGLTAEALESVAVEPGETLPWDRAFALAQGDAPFDPAAAALAAQDAFHVPDGQRPRRPAARQFRRALRRAADPRPGRQRDRENRRSPRPGATASPPGWRRSWTHEARGVPRFHHAPGHSFSDVSAKVVSIINLASVADLAAPRRRAAAPSALPRQSLSARRRGLERTRLGRAGTAGRPGTAARGQAHSALCGDRGEPRDGRARRAIRWRSCATPSAMSICGVYAEVVEGGQLAVGDAVELLPA